MLADERRHSGSKSFLQFVKELLTKELIKNITMNVSKNLEEGETKLLHFQNTIMKDGKTNPLDLCKLRVNKII